MTRVQIINLQCCEQKHNNNNIMHQSTYHFHGIQQSLLSYQSTHELQHINRPPTFSGNDEKQNKNFSQKQNQENKMYIAYELSSNSSENDIYKNINQKRQQKNLTSEPLYVINVKQRKQSQFQTPRKNKNDKSNSAVNIVNKTETKQSTSNKSDKMVSSFGAPADMKRKKTALTQIQAEEDCKIYKNGSWTRTKLMITENKMSFFQFSFDIEHLRKIKILPSDVSKTRAENIIKIQVQDEVNLFSLSLDKKFYGLPTAFYIFAKLIDKKLELNNLAADEDWEKSEHIQKSATQDSYIYGNIMKKSQHLGKWQQRFIVIKKNGIYSYRDSKQQQSYSFHINSESVKYIWTRFDLMSEHLIIKVKHGLYKTEFGIPISRYSCRSTKNWLYCFYRTMPIPFLSNTK